MNYTIRYTTPSRSLNNTRELRNIILENPGLPLLVFCRRDREFIGDFGYIQTAVRWVSVEELVRYDNKWMDKEEYTDELAANLYDEDEKYENLPDGEYFKLVEERVEQTEFTKVIVCYLE